MRNPIARVRCSLALLVVLLVAAPVVIADDVTLPDPPEARINPPIGVASNARINPPIGVTSEPTFFELMLRWLAARINPPIG